MFNALCLHPWRWWLLVSRFFRDHFILEGPRRLLDLYTSRLVSMSMDVIRRVNEGTEKISDIPFGDGGDMQSFINWCLVEIEYSKPVISKGEAEIITRARERGHTLAPKDAEDLRRYAISAFHRRNALRIVSGLLSFIRDDCLEEGIQACYRERVANLLVELEFVCQWDLPMTYDLVADVAELVCDAKHDFRAKPAAVTVH